MKIRYVIVFLVVLTIVLSLESVLASGGEEMFLPLVLGGGRVNQISSNYVSAFAWQDAYGMKVKLIRSKDWSWDELVEFRGPNSLPDDWVVFESKGEPCILYRLYSVQTHLFLVCRGVLGDPQVLYTMDNADTLIGLSAISYGDELLLVWQEGYNKIVSAKLYKEGEEFKFEVLSSYQGFSPSLGENGKVAFYTALSGNEVGLYVVDNPEELQNATLVDSWSWGSSFAVAISGVKQTIAISPSGLLAYWRWGDNTYPIARGMVVGEVNVRELGWYDDTTLLVQTGDESNALVYACSLSGSAWRCTPLINGYSSLRVGEGLVAHLYLDSSLLIGGEMGRWAKPCMTKLLFQATRTETVCLDNPQDANYMKPRKVLLLSS